MKRLAVFILVTVISLMFFGCGSTANESGYTATLYYIRSEYEYHSTENVIVGEARTLASEAEIGQLLDLYLAGPVDDRLASPIPKGTDLLDMREYSGLLELTFSDTEAVLTDAQFSLACVCIGKTMMEDPDIIQVTVFSGDRQMTVDRNNYLLTDEVGDADISKEAIP